MSKSHSPRLFTIPGPRGPVAVACWGDGPPLLLLSGLGSGRRIWGEFPSVLARRFTVIAPDNRGIGGSHRGDPFTIAGAAEDAALALSECRFSSAAVLGVSLGGIIACHLAAGHPGTVTRLAALSCGARCTPFNRRLARFFELITTRMAPAEAAECLMTFAFGAAFTDRFPGYVEQAESLWTPEPEDLPGVAAQIAAIGSDWDLRPLLASIACPALAVGGELDPIVPLAAVQELAESIPGCRFRIVNGAAHSVLAEGGPILVQEISDFLAGGPTRTGPA